MIRYQLSCCGRARRWPAPRPRNPRARPSRRRADARRAGHRLHLHRPAASRWPSSSSASSRSATGCCVTSARLRRAAAAAPNPLFIELHRGLAAVSDALGPPAADHMPAGTALKAGSNGHAGRHASPAARAERRAAASTEQWPRRFANISGSMASSPAELPMRRRSARSTAAPTIICAGSRSTSSAPADCRKWASSSAMSSSIAARRKS